MEILGEADSPCGHCGVSHACGAKRWWCRGCGRVLCFKALWLGTTLYHEADSGHACGPVESLAGEAVMACADPP